MIHRQLLIALVLIGGPAASPELFAQIPATDSASIATIERLLAAADAEALARETTETALADLTKANPALAPFRNILKEFLEKYTSYAVIKPDLVQLYRSTFTEGEVREIIKLYESPSARRFMRRLAIVGAKAGQLATQRVQANLPELLQGIQERGSRSPD